MCVSVCVCVRLLNPLLCLGIKGVSHCYLEGVDVQSVCVCVCVCVCVWVLNPITGMGGWGRGTWLAAANVGHQRGTPCWHLVTTETCIFFPNLHTRKTQMLPFLPVSLSWLYPLHRHDRCISEVKVWFWVKEPKDLMVILVA